MVEIAAWTILVLFSLGGLVGIFLPVFPGVLLILLGALLHKLLLPDFLSWWTIGVVALGFALTYGIDLMGSVVGAKWGGASRYGMTGLLIGGLVGLFFGLPGLILGPLVGVFVGEVFIASRSLAEGTRAGVGATLGLAASTVLKFFLGVILIVWIFVDIFFFRLSSFS